MGGGGLFLKSAPANENWQTTMLYNGIWGPRCTDSIKMKTDKTDV